MPTGEGQRSPWASGAVPCGNRRLTYENSPNPLIPFQNRAGRAVTVSILPEAIDELMRQLAKDAPAEEAAYKAAAMAEEELFKVAPL